jgi:acetyl-CoA carboxylase carboxyl transferase subunit alpha
MKEMSRLRVPILNIVTGEGGSGGAMGIGVGDRMAMLEKSYLTVASPEVCAAILWKDHRYAKEAAEGLKLTSCELFGCKLIDAVIYEARDVRQYIYQTLEQLDRKPMDQLLFERYQKLRFFGKFACTSEDSGV